MNSGQNECIVPSCKQTWCVLYTMQFNAMERDHLWLRYTTIDSTPDTDSGRRRLAVVSYTIGSYCAKWVTYLTFQQRTVYHIVIFVWSCLIAYTFALLELLFGRQTFTSFNHFFKTIRLHLNYHLIHDIKFLSDTFECTNDLWKIVFHAAVIRDQASIRHVYQKKKDDGCF